MVSSEPLKLGLLDRVRVALFGYIKVRDEWLGHGWGEIYVYRCPNCREYVESYTHTWAENFWCPLCGPGTGK